MNSFIAGCRYLAILTCLTVLTACSKDEVPQASKAKQDADMPPNIVLFYVDDLGYGDLGVYGAKGVATPNIDALAANGIRFTDAHTTAATCTPSRYSLLTGQYAFRKDARILPGDAALLIDTQQPTLPGMLKKAGYSTAVVGKWHLGLGATQGDVDWNDEVKPGPLEIGFDYSFLLPATGDRVPSVYLENHHVVNLSQDDPLTVSYKEKVGSRPTGYENPELLRQAADESHNKTIINGISRIGWMAGGKSAEWVDEQFHTVFTEKSANFISQNSNKPFFLYFSFHDIHVPRLPNKLFQGKSSMGPRGDAIVQMDWITGEVVKQLKQQGVLENTLIIFTSDNGAVLNDGYEDQSVELLGEHMPNGVYRGGKYSAFEAGTRVPTIVHFPERVKAGVSDALFSQVDIYASLANLVGVELAPDEAIDSENNLPALLNAELPARSQILEESYTLSLREGQWKYIRPTAANKSRMQEKKKIEFGLQKTPQLFDLEKDPGEQTNLATQYPDKVVAMEKAIAKIQEKTMR